MAKREDLKFYTADKWYFNLYDNGNLVVSRGFYTKEQADAYANFVAEDVESHIKNGAKRVPGITERVEEARGWIVDGKEFSDFHEALWYMWTERPDAQIKGIF